MTDFETSYLTLVEPSKGDEIRYQTDLFYEDAEDSIAYPEFDHPRVIEHVEQHPESEHGPTTLVYALASAPTVTAVAAMVRAFILRNKDRKVVIRGRSGKARLEVTGDFSVEDIERLLRAQIEEEEGS